MTAEAKPRVPGSLGFRTRLLLAMMLLVSVVAVSTLVFTQRNLAARARVDFERQFSHEIAALHRLQEFRDQALAERCRILAGKPRIHAALEDGALDLLYPSARDELRSLIEVDDAPGQGPGALRARFYRFLDARGAVIDPAQSQGAGRLSPEEQAKLCLPRLPDQPQTGYIVRSGASGAESLDEVIAMPIVSTENGDTISALVLGFRPQGLAGEGAGDWVQSGIWTGGTLWPRYSMWPSNRAGLKTGSQS